MCRLQRYHFPANVASFKVGIPQLQAVVQSPMPSCLACRTGKNSPFLLTFRLYSGLIRRKAVRFHPRDPPATHELKQNAPCKHHSPSRLASPPSSCSWPSNPPSPTFRVTVVTPRTAPPVRLARLSTPHERLARAQAYLSSHKSISVKRYSRLTGLTKSAARTELDAFTRDRSSHIVAVGTGKRRCYTLAR